MRIKSKVFKGVCLAGMMLVTLSFVSCSRATCDLLNERPAIIHQLPVDKVDHVIEQICSHVLADKFSFNVAMSGDGYYNSDGFWTEESEDGIISTLIAAIIKIFGGVAMFFIATYMLWRNESRYLRKKHTLEEVDKLCIIMENPNTRDPSMEGKLVCATATASTDEILSDPDFGIQINAIFLSRKVMYYQWVEESETETTTVRGKTRSRTVYKYKQQWVDKPIDSQSFHDPYYQDRNFVIFSMESKKQWAKKVEFGAYVLNDQLKKFMISEPLHLDLDDKILEDWNACVAKSLGVVVQNPKEIAKAFTSPLPITENVTQEQDLPVTGSVTQEQDLPVTGNVAQGQDLPVTGNEKEAPKKEYDYVHQIKNALYFGKKPSNPTTGDVRITFKQVLSNVVTVVSQVSGNTFVPYTSRVDEEYQKLVMGESNDDLIIEKDTEQNKWKHWKIRILATAATGLGLFMSFQILFTLLEIVFSFIPFISNTLMSVVDLTGFVFMLACLLVGFVWSVINIFIAWLYNLIVVNIQDRLG